MTEKELREMIDVSEAIDFLEAVIANIEDHMAISIRVPFDEKGLPLILRDAFKEWVCSQLKKYQEIFDRTEVKKP